MFKDPKKQQLAIITGMRITELPFKCGGTEQTYSIITVRYICMGTMECTKLFLKEASDIVWLMRFLEIPFVQI